MKPNTKIHLIVAFLSLVVLSSCIKEEQYPIEPAIEFAGFGVIQDVNKKDSVGVLTVSYTDGDGDIGLYNYDTVEPYRYNYYLRFFQMHNGTAVEIKPADTSVSFNGRIPLLTPTGRNKNISGEISMFMDLFYARPLFLNDTIDIKFEVYIKDRALHTSNIVETPLFKIRK